MKNVRVYKEVEPVRLAYAQVNFAEAIAKKRDYNSMQNAVDTMLANAKIAANELNKVALEKLAYLKVTAADYKFLFNDLQQMIGFEKDHFEMTVRVRIESHKKAEAEALRKTATHIEQAAQYADRSADRNAELAGAAKLRKQADDIELSFTDDSIEIEPTIIKPVKSGSITQAMIVFAIAEKYGLSDDQALQVILNAFDIEIEELAA
jgi:hypothetical protein